MKVLIVDTVPRERATYLSYYLNACEELNIEYDRFIWDRSQDGEIEHAGHEIVYHGRGYDGNVSKLKKLYPLYKYRRALKNAIREGRYTHMILVNTIAPVILVDFIRRNFKDRYIMDIRDYTYEKWSLYKKCVDQLVEDSAFSVISSMGFYRFLNYNSKIIVAHNISNVNDTCKEVTLGKREKNTIGFVGYVRYKEENLKLIESFKNSNRYQLLYAGGVTEGCNLQEVCRENGVNNVSFLGKFDNEKKGTIYSQIDIINSLYGSFSLEVMTAIPNRYYDALIFKKPIIASKGTFLGELVEEKKIGIAIDVFRDDVIKKVDDYIDRFDKIAFEKSCNEELKRVIAEQYIYTCRIRDFLTGIKG